MDEEQNIRKLENALRAMSNEDIFVSPETDENVLRAIRDHFAATPNAGRASALPVHGASCPVASKPKAPPRPHRKQITKPWHNWLPLAASIAIGASILYFSRPVPDRADINRDGTVDIIDALLLAEQAQSAGGPDLNNDGTISDADAAEIATRAVSLERTRS